MQQQEYWEERNKENYTCIHRSNYTSEKSNKIVSSNLNLMGKKRKNSHILAQAKLCKMIKICKPVYCAQRWETIARRTSLLLYLGKWIFSDIGALLRPAH